MANGKCSEIHSQVETIHSQVETERRKLQRACAVLSCLIGTAEDAESAGDVDMADVAYVVREVVLAALDGLDSARLGNSRPRRHRR